MIQYILLFCMMHETTSLWSFTPPFLLCVFRSGLLIADHDVVLVIGPQKLFSFSLSLSLYIYNISILWYFLCVVMTYIHIYIYVDSLSYITLSSSFLRTSYYCTYFCRAASSGASSSCRAMLPQTALHASPSKPQKASANVSSMMG